MVLWEDVAQAGDAPARGACCPAVVLPVPSQNQCPPASRAERSPALQPGCSRCAPSLRGRGEPGTKPVPQSCRGAVSQHKGCG